MRYEIGGAPIFGTNKGLSQKYAKTKCQALESVWHLVYT